MHADNFDGLHYARLEWGISILLLGILQNVNNYVSKTRLKFFSGTSVYQYLTTFMSIPALCVILSKY